MGRMSISCVMSLPMQWMAWICHATLSGLAGQSTTPSGFLMHGKAIGSRWIGVDSWPLLALSIFSKPLVLTQSDLGGQLHVQRWVSWMVALGMTPTSTIWRKVSSCLPPGASLPSDGLVRKRQGGCGYVCGRAE